MAGSESLHHYDGCTADELAHLLGVPRCICYRSLGSTLDVVHEIAAGGAESHTLVLADEQTAGRGRHGRPWHSPPGSGIWLGYLARPAAGRNLGVFSIRIGLTLAGVLEELGARPRLKWPNDVILMDRKVAGILCEGRWSGEEPCWIAVGIGINVKGPLPRELEESAIPLDRVVPAVERVEVLRAVVPRLRGAWDEPALSDEERRRFDRYHSLRGRRVAGPVEGIVGSVEPDGSLQVETERGSVTITGGSLVVA